MKLAMAEEWRVAWWSKRWCLDLIEERENEGRCCLPCGQGPLHSSRLLARRENIRQAAAGALAIPIRKTHGTEQVPTLKFGHPHEFQLCFIVLEILSWSQDRLLNDLRLVGFLDRKSSQLEGIVNVKGLSVV